MALWVCAGEAGCGTKYAVGLFRCPRCHNTEFFEDGDPMAKISRHGGASDKTLPTPEVAAAAEPVSASAAAADQPELVEIGIGPGQELVDVTEHVADPVEPVKEEGGEGSSPGSSSETSTETPQQSSEPSSKPSRKPARKTASRSAKAPTETSSAPSTDGGPTEPTSAADGE